MSYTSDSQDHIALEEYLGSLDHPAAILLCLAETEYGRFSNPVLSPAVSAGSPTSSHGNHLAATRPQLVKMSSGTGSYGWPSTYGSTSSSTGSSGRIPRKGEQSSPLPNHPGTLLSCPPDECKLVWGNRYMTADLEELLLVELKRDGLLQRAWSMGNAKNNRIYTLASKQSSDRRISWRITGIRAGRYLILTGHEESQDPVSWHDDPAKVEAERPKSPPRWISVPGETEATRQHNELFGSVDWATTPLGRPERWCQSLLTMVNVCLSSPFPVLIAWGPELVLLYNEPYGKSIGTKHPGILGMRYDLAWPEVWEHLAPVVAQAMAGTVVHVDDAQMFLKRGNFVEGKYSLLNSPSTGKLMLMGTSLTRTETYFTWSMIPLRGPAGAVDGIFIPNFDNTGRLVSERRIHTLNILSRAITESRNVEQIASFSLPAFQNNNDIGFMIMYLSQPVEDDTDPESQEMESQRTRSTMESSRRHSTVGDDNRLEFRLAGHSGCVEIEENDKYVPHCVLSDRSRPLDTYDDSHGLAKYIHMAHCYNEAVAITEADDMQELLPNLTPNAFGDLPVYAVVMPIRSSVEDRTHGVVIIGLNTRLEFTTAYKDWLNTIRGLLATGLASVKLHEEQMARAHYLAALNKRKNEELQVLLKKKTDDLRSAELTMSTAFDCCPTGIWIADANREIVFLNPAYYQITGLHPEASLSSWVDLVHPDDREMAIKAFSDVRYKRSKTEFRILKRKPDTDGKPEIRWLEGTAGPPYDSIGQICGTIMDITHRKEKEEFQLRRAEDALERKRQQESFIDMTSHELRNPLSAICLAMEGIVDQLDMVARKSEPSLEAELRTLIKDTDVVSLCTQHMKRLIDDVLSLSKLDSELLQISDVACRPLSFTREVLSMFEPELQSKAITYSLEVCDGYRQLVPDGVKVDPQRVTQVLINLLTNAIKFTSNAPTRRIHCSLDASYCIPEGGLRSNVNISSEPLGSDYLYLIWSVQDTGPGLSEEESGRLFQRFQQAQPKTHVTYGGSGLGLFISRKLTTLLGGNIFLQSQPGKGSTFTFYVQAQPCSCPSEIDKTAEVSPSQPAFSREAKPSVNRAGTKNPNEPSLRVLLTEDNLINQQLLRRQLMKAGCTVYIANDGVEALEFVADGNSPLDCILMDIEMPRMSGIECTREIRRLKIGIPIIAVTANARSEQIAEIMACGMDAAVAKPFTTSDLVKQMRQLIAAK